MAVCDTPLVLCNKSSLQDPITQKYLLVHLLASTLGVSTDDATLKSLSAGYLCQGSPAALKQQEATTIAGKNLAGVDLTHIACWSPLQLEAVMAYLVCRAAAAL